MTAAYTARSRKRPQTPAIATFAPSAGMTPKTAIAAVLPYRISTYYAPPLWGFPAMLWLQRNRYL